MPRIRSIKPEHWGDKNLPKISIGAHLLWIGTWNFSDDKGVIENDSHFLKSNVFPRRKEVKASHIEKWIEELIKYDFVIPFEHNGFQYIIHRTFDVHQKIDKPQKSKIEDAIIRRVFDEYSSSNNRTFDDASAQDRIGEDKDRIGIGKDDEYAKPLDDFLAPKMVKLFKQQFPNYPMDKKNDFSACFEIAKKISKENNWSEKEMLNGKMECVIDLWKTIVNFVSKDKWFSTRSINDLNKEWQRLIQSINSQNGKQSKPTGANVSASSLLEKINAMPD